MTKPLFVAALDPPINVASEASAMTITARVVSRTQAMVDPGMFFDHRLIKARRIRPRLAVLRPTGGVDNRRTRG